MYASGQEQRRCQTADGNLWRFKVAWKAYSSFCLQPKMILAYPVLSAWPKNQPFPKKALRQIQKWGSIIDLTLQTKDALVLLWVRLVPKAGASKKLQPAVYQRRCPTWVLFSSSALNLRVNGMLLGEGLGLFQSLWNLQYVFIWNDVLSFIKEANFLSAYMWDSVLGWSKAWCCYPRGLWD